MQGLHISQVDPINSWLDINPKFFDLYLSIRYQHLFSIGVDRQNRTEPIRTAVIFGKPNRTENRGFFQKTEPNRN